MIINWLTEETNGEEVEHVDTTLLAHLSIFVILCHRIISSLAICFIEKSILRATIQFFDVLIYSEIFLVHKQIVFKLFNDSNDDGNSDTKESKIDSYKFAIDSTLSFKFVRSLENVLLLPF